MEISKFINIKLVLCIIVLFIVLYVYYNTRIPGCMDKNAVNYNPDANLEKLDSCIYPVVGCTNPNAVNYNKWANVSCTEDCEGISGKSLEESLTSVNSLTSRNNGINSSKCEFTKSCSSTPENICKFNVTGCSREWSSNYNYNASVDDNSCNTIDNYMRRITVFSGGAARGCSNKVYVKIDDDYIISDGGNDGINMVVLSRDVDKVTNKIIVRYIKSFNTGVNPKSSDDFVSFCQNYLHPSDIVILAVKSDMIGKQDDTLKQVISSSAQAIIKMLGGKKHEMIPLGSYILIGTLMLDVYYESANQVRDSYYPMFNLTNYGCITIRDPSFVKIKLDSSKYLMLTSNNINSDEFVWRCALEAHSIGASIFLIKGNDCYIVIDSTDTLLKAPYIDKFKLGANASKYLRYNWGAGDSTSTLVPTNINNEICSINSLMLTIGNPLSENYYKIVDAYHSGFFLEGIGSAYTYIYSGENFTGLETSLETGIQTSTKILSQSQNALANGGIDIIQVNSIKVPIHHFAIAFKTIYDDYTKNDYEGSREYYVFNGPATNKIKMGIPYEKYSLIAKNQKYPTTISQYYIINGFNGILLFENTGQSGLVIRLAYGKYILPSMYIKPYYWKIKNMVNAIIYDLNLINLYVDTNGNDVTSKTLLDTFKQLLPLTIDQLKNILLTFFKSLNRTDFENLTNKYLSYVDGFNVKSLRSYYKPNASVRFFSDTEFKNLIYTFYAGYFSPGVPFQDVSDVSNNINKLIKAVIVDKIGIIQIYTDLNSYSFYPNLSYNGLNIDKKNYMSLQSFKENDRNNINYAVFNWSQNIGITIDDNVTIIRLKSINDNDNIDAYYFVNTYKNLYDQIYNSIFNLLNFTSDDISSFPITQYYINELTMDLPNPTIDTTVDGYVIPSLSGKTIKLGRYLGPNNFMYEETVLVNNKRNSYFYNGINTIAYLNHNTNTKIFIAQLPINGEKIINDFKKTSLQGYDITFNSGLIELTDNLKNKTYYLIQNNKYWTGTTYDLLQNIYIENYKNIIIYNLDPIDNTSDYIKINSSINELVYNRLSNLFGGLLIYDENKKLTKFIPVFRSQLFVNNRWVGIGLLQSILDYKDIYCIYYNFLNSGLSLSKIGCYICPINNQNITNINKLSGLTNQLNNLQVPCYLQMFNQPWNSDESPIDQFDNFIGYTFRNLNNNVIFTAGTRIISVSAGNWKINFSHDLGTADPIISTLYIPGPCVIDDLINKYDRSIYNGEVIINYKNDIVVDIISPADFLSSDLYGFITKVEKKWPLDTNQLEPTYVEYIYSTNRWLIKMPYNLPVLNISWSRYYGL
jgi:hypothetical protein